MTPEAVIYRYLEAAKALSTDTGELSSLLAILGTDADLLGRWLVLLDCPADPAALRRALSAFEPEALGRLAEAQAWAGSPIADAARLSLEQWQSALLGACLGERLAEALDLDNPPSVGWQLLLAISGFNLPGDPAVEELLAFRGSAPNLLEDADPLLKIGAVVDGLETRDVDAAQAIADQLLELGAGRFYQLVDQARADAAARAEAAGLAQLSEDDWAERLWARQQVSLLGSTFAQCDSVDALVVAHRFASRNLFGFVPYLLLFDPAREALLPAGNIGVGILLGSRTSTIARSVRERIEVELTNTPDQAVADRQVLRRLAARDGRCLPLMDDERPLGALAFRLDEDVDHGFLMQAYADEFSRWIAARTETGQRTDALADFRSHEEKRLREIVHEANNPLSIVHNYLHILELRLQHEPAAVEQLQMIGAELNRATQIIQRARDVPSDYQESPEQDEPDVQWAEFDLNRLASQAVELHQGYAAEHSVRLAPALAPGAIMVTSDQQRIAQVLNNLLRNAIEASAGATVSVGSAAGIFRSGREGVEFSVADTGPGLPRQVVEALAEPKQTDKGGDHAGLGLHIVHRLVAEVGGSVDVRTRPGEGTTFTIYLPLNAERLSLPSELQ